MSVFLELRGLVKSVNRRRLFEISELAVHHGECLLLTGPNGSGKTTLLKILAGLEAPDRGDVVVDGVCHPWRQAIRHYRSKVLYLHQQPYMFDTTVHANVAYGLERRTARERVAEALAWAGLGDQATRNARQLSGGEKQRVALARAWAQEPRLLLLDEAAANLDAPGREQLYAYLRSLRARGTSFVLTHHTPEEVLASCDRHLRFEDGRLEPTAADATPIAIAGASTPASPLAEAST